MGDSLRGGIYKITVDSKEEKKMIDNTMCPSSLSLDYSTRDLYWFDGCSFQLQTTKMDGSNRQVINTGSALYFSYGSSVYKSHFYWTEIVDMYSFDIGKSVREKICSVPDGAILQDVHVVHPSNQPSGR